MPGALIDLIKDNECVCFSTAEHYLSSSREPGELYCETYQKVAVLFASMPDFMESFRDDSDLQAGLHCLKTLNEIIRSFDMVTFPTLYFLASSLSAIYLMRPT